MQAVWQFVIATKAAFSSPSRSRCKQRHAWSAETSHAKIVKELRRRINTGDKQVVACASAGHVAKRAGLESWSKWCHTLRKNAETDWAQRFPQYVVSYWLGHGIEVSGKHYLQVPEELYRKFMPPGRKRQVPKKATA